jgi:hypothetical protein
MSAVLVLYVSPYDFKNEAGQRINGLTVEYLDLDQNPNEHARESTKGLTVFKDTMEPDALEHFSVVPGLYELSYRKIRDAKGKQATRVNGAKLVKGINLSKLPELASKAPQTV